MKAVLENGAQFPNTLSISPLRLSIHARTHPYVQRLLCASALLICCQSRESVHEGNYNVRFPPLPRSAVALCRTSKSDM